MRIVHRTLIAAAVFVCLLGFTLVPAVRADEFGCYGDTVRCAHWFYGPGNCGYNASWNGCTCRGTLPLELGEWEVGSYDCQQSAQ